MIRWRFILTRLIVIVAVLVLLRWGLGPVASYVTVRGLQTVTGAKVDIAKTRIGFFPPRVRFVDVAIADPRAEKKMQDTFRASSIELVIDGDALLHRRWVAQQARVTGLQIGARRETSGHIAPLDHADASHHGEGESMLSRLVGATAEKLTGQADSVVGSLETVRLSQEIRKFWEAEFSKLVDRAQKLELQIRTVRDQARGIDNPLRDWPQLEQTLARSRAARNELLSVRQAIDSLPKRLQTDLALLDKAKQNDLAKVDRFVPGDLANVSEFGIDMLAESVRAQIQQIRSYLDGGRTLANYTIVAPESAARIRGVRHELNKTYHPDLLIRRCEIDGVMRADGNVYAMTGVIDNLTTTPELLAEPTRARLRLEGPEILRVEYVRDRRSNADADLLTLHWPQTDAKPIRLGGDDDAGISIDGGQHELWVQVRTDGDKIDGRLVSKQTGVRIGLSVDSRFADSAAAVSLQQSLAAVDRVEIDANFTGTWKDLDVQLKSNLSQILSNASQAAVAGQIRQAREQLVEKVNQAHLEQSLALRQWLESQQSEARSLLANADKSIEEMSQTVLDEAGGADAYLGKLRSAIRGQIE